MTSTTTSPRSLLARAYWAASRYRVVGAPLRADRAALYIGAPHTSNWDFVLATALLWRNGIRAKVLMKNSMTDGPLGPIVRALGALPVDRDNPGRLVDQLVTEARERPDFGLVIAPEGTRSRTESWKSGFYRIALATGLPVVPVSVDRPTRLLRVGEARTMTGDTVADMDALRAFYRGTLGVRPGRGGPVRLRDEARDFRPGDH